jgi:glutaminyl-peptide cyclotransferase
MKSLLPAIGLIMATLGVEPPALASGLDTVATLPFTIIAKRAHDRRLFTQGMAFHGDLLVESGGNYRESRVIVRETDHPSPRAEQRLPATWFGEGLAVQDDRAVVLTWRENTAQVLSLPGLEPLSRFPYEGEGWGLAWDGRSFIQSDGSERLTWRDPETFGVQHTMTVRAGHDPVPMLNELEWVEGRLLANIWLSDWIVVIDPATGKVLGKLDLAALLNPAERRHANVTNGIAWQASQRLLWVSGKNWPWMFALRLELPATGKASK